MGENKRYGLIPHLDVEQILVDAQNRWLRPAEICQVLRNFHNFHIAPESPNRPLNLASTVASFYSILLHTKEEQKPVLLCFLRRYKVLRYFRKDGHNWRKKKDGKIVKEAHERLKSGSIDVLHCYYAHGEENENFQRRSYWMLEDDFMHIVLVHYLEVKGNKTNRTKGVQEISHGVYDCSPVSLNSLASHDQITSQSTGDNSLYTTQISGYGDSETDNYQASSRYNSFPVMPQFDDNSMMDALLNYVPIPQNLPRDYEEERAISSYSGLCSLAQEDKLLNETSDTSQSGNYGITLHGPTSKMDLASWNETLEHCGTTYQPYFPSTFDGNLKSIHNGKDTMFCEVIIVEPSVTHENTAMAKGYQIFQDVGHASIEPNVDVKKVFSKEGNILHSEEGLEKHDSFSRWMKGADNSHIESSYGTYCDVVESESAAEDSSSSRQDHLYTYLLSPSLSQDQLFGIIDFSPNWAYANLETKVLVTGKFLKCKSEVERCKWSCMFGEVEVLAEILGDGILRCYAPPQTAGRVPFYITCSDRLACSEIREFEYLASHAQYMEMSETYAGRKNETLLYTRLEKLLALGPNDPLELTYSSAGEKSHLCNQISSLLLKAADELSNMVKEATRTDFTSSTAKDELLQKILKEKLHAWLLCKVVEDGNGPNVLDNEGQGVIHLVAGLGYDWAIESIIVAGVNINFRDSRGWSALHWASSFGRRRTVAVLITLGAAPGALTDPTPEFPSGRTPADLASSNGHKGLSGFLAKSSLTTHLSALALRDSGLSVTADTCCVKAFEDNGETHAIKLDQEGMEVESPLQDSLSAVYVATLAAASIQQVFRMQSFQRKKLIDYTDSKFGMFDERALSRVCGKSRKSGQLDEPVQAAVRIQNKFRGWKGRKEFTVIRQHIVKIQAHVRGHQVRKHFKKVVWSVGIMEKAILRWRRKGSRLRGFHSKAVTGDSNMLKQHTEEEDYDFLREGRKQTEARLERALARVKSMVQNPEGRDQYRKLLMDIQNIKESKSMVERIMMEEIDDCAMFNIKELLDEDAPMPAACV